MKEYHSKKDLGEMFEKYNKSGTGVMGRLDDLEHDMDILILTTANRDEYLALLRRIIAIEKKLKKKKPTKKNEK